MNYTFCRRLDRVAILVGMVIIAIHAAGCTHFADKRMRAREKLEEHSRALTTAVVDTLQHEPEENRDQHTELALRLAREDQRIEGLPFDPIPVEPLLELPAGSPARKAAEQSLDGRFAEIERRIKEEHVASERLLQFGAELEEQQNERRWRWTRWIGGGSAVLAALVALMVFVPAAIPIVGRVIAWLVGKVPALAGAFGVVSVKAFDAVIKGVERSKSSSERGVALSNMPGREDPGGWIEQLHSNLSREMDAAHKALVRSRKAALNWEGRP